MFSAISFFTVSTSVNKRRPRNHARFAKQNWPKTIVFSMFLHFSMVSEEAFFSIKFACRTRFSDLNYIGPFSKNDIKTNVFLTISFAVNSQFIATSTFVVNLRKHEIVKIPLVFVPLLMFCFGRTSCCESKNHRNLRSKRKIPIFSSSATVDDRKTKSLKNIGFYSISAPENSFLHR